MARLTSTFFFGTAIVVSLGLMLARRLDIRPDLIPAWSPTFIVLASHVASLSLYLTYRAWIYPLLLDPTRHIPGPIVGVERELIEYSQLTNMLVRLANSRICL